jgi:aldehyde:ferredoxin oxidoreductase
MFGFHGRYWRFDLSAGRGEFVPIEERILRRTLGGVGLGSWLLHREAPPGVEPFAPEAPLVFAFSPLVGTALTTSAKFSVVAKSPLTGGICDALSSSHFAIAGKRMGVDAIVLTGACDEPSELVDGRLRPTGSWGLSAEETARALKPFGRVAAIGVAGERLVRYANISADGRHAGRGGLGAVMGAKRLKAIAVRGEADTQVADPESVARIAAELRRGAAGEATAKYREIGTVGNLLAFDRLGALPTRNFQQSHFEGAESLAAERMRPTRRHVRSSCASCTIGCEHRYGFGREGATRIEYESLFALGPLCGIADPDAVLAASRRCDELGLDTISAGATLAFAMECGERGWLEEGPRFGEGERLVVWLDDIAHRRGLGAQLAEGSRQMAIGMGDAALAIAPQVKGLELPGYEPRSLQTMALGFAVGTRGADHNRSGAYEIDFSEDADRLRGDARSARLATETEDRAALIDSLILCKFLRGALENFYGDSAEMLRAVTGIEFTADELRDVAQRVVALRKLFNIREGWQPSDDTLPERFLSEALPSGPVAGARLGRERLEEMVRAYNLARGWREAGGIGEATTGRLLAELELDPGRQSEAGIARNSDTTAPGVASFDGVADAVPGARLR